LRAGDAEAAHAAIELGPQQPGDVRNHDPNIFIGIWHGAVAAAGKSLS
jgi:hypothetical protein